MCGAELNRRQHRGRAPFVHGEIGSAGFGARKRIFCLPRKTCALLRTPNPERCAAACACGRQGASGALFCKVERSGGVGGVAGVGCKLDERRRYISWPGTTFLLNTHALRVDLPPQATSLFLFLICIYVFEWDALEVPFAVRRI